MYTLLKKIFKRHRAACEPTPREVVATIHNPIDLEDFLDRWFEKYPTDVLEIRRQQAGDLEKLKSQREDAWKSD